MSSSSEIAPAALYTEYSSGEAWPLERIRWSLLGFSGSSKSYLRYLLNSTARRSAADIEEVGCPEPAPELERMLSTLSCWASACHCSAPAVSWLICCVTTNLLGRIARKTDSTSPTPHRRIENGPRAPDFRRTHGGSRALLESLGREEKDPDRPFCASGLIGRKGDAMDLAVRKMTLERFGVENVGAVHENLPPARLVEASVRRREGMISGSGALVVRTGKRTGRSPKDRFIVENDVTREAVDWGTGNKAFPSDAFGDLLDKAAAYVENLEEIYVVDAYAGADPRYRLNVHVVTEHAWQALFARQLFRRPSKEELDSFEPDWTVISVPGFLTDPEEDGTESETFVGIDFERKVVLVCGTAYAGEIKKSIFTVLNFVLPTERGVFPMHCSANVGGGEAGGDVALFFGLSGTGKTTLSADPERGLIGDDEHGWSKDGIFNFEGGCYAKAINLSAEGEPDIYRTTQMFGTVLENVVLNEPSRSVDFANQSI